MALKKYRETEQSIEEAKQLYSPDYFKTKKFTAPEIPSWKRELLAKRFSSEAITNFEEKAWRNFLEWKKRNAPSINLLPPEPYARQWS
ncbi:unnamed protein product [Strongylus vulgaris]|uniref:Uncharacterized protein n=1 Tax=Strongylus vulgaris TaxID=40348 RepID=A0A3P7IWH1_STRVU|nr:unnamed protein product [Strongylus vulgaris]